MRACTRITTIAIVMFPVIALAQTAPSTPPAAPATDVPPVAPATDVKAAAAVICVDQESGSGSRLTHRVCHTKDEWQKLGGVKR
jgi:hypothetical protein